MEELLEIEGGQRFAYTKLLWCELGDATDTETERQLMATLTAVETDDPTFRMARQGIAASLRGEVALAGAVKLTSCL